MLEEKIIAPNFSLPNSSGDIVSLEDFRGKKVVLYFYPKDNTTGCTKQACAFGERYSDFTAKNVVVIGISKDSTASHIKFADKYNLPFILLSDTELVAIKAYDVWKEKTIYGKKYMGVERMTYMIDENGYIEKAMSKVKPETNASDILAYLG